MTTPIEPILLKLAEKSPYGYTPTFWICTLFVVLFSFSTALHLGEALYFKPRLYWLLPTVVMCGLCEIIGWSARLWSSQDPLVVNAFLIQSTTTSTGPTSLTVVFYNILANIMTILGSRYSRLRPRTYLIAVIVQAVGSVKAAAAFKTGKDSTSASQITLAGIFLQIASITLYLLLATEFLLRFHFQKPLYYPMASNETSSLTVDGAQPQNVPNSGCTAVFEGRGVLSQRLGLMVLGLMLATLFVLIRFIYRSLEISGGGSRRTITTEKYFNILDGAPIALAMFILNCLHPGFLLRQDATRHNRDGMKHGV